MVKIENHLGTIEVSQSYFTSLIGHTVTNCFGVTDMNPSGAKQGLLSVLRRGNFTDKGVSVRNVRNRLFIDLHITVMFGVNIAVIVKSIVSKVRYTVEEETGLKVEKVNVYVDGMRQ
ncbi:MAG TPA: Asp23/Gls24 family envelope stress response protein [Oscillospiraceae bacterium]|nr:Asp23/Gls24 family envelope stress response protein [Oscillospiraceae bacterium]